MPPIRVRFAPLCLAFLLACTGQEETTPVPAYAIQKVAGDDQMVTPSSGSAPFIIRIVDQDDAPVSGLPVTWYLRQGSGTVAPGPNTTDAEGEARAIIFVGPDTGTRLVEAIVGGIDSVQFTVIVAVPPTGPCAANGPVPGRAVFDTLTPDSCLYLGH
jgi:hypothetical protein